MGSFAVWGILHMCVCSHCAALAFAHFALMRVAPSLTVPCNASFPLLLQAGLAELNSLLLPLDGQIAYYMVYIYIYIHIYVYIYIYPNPKSET